MNIKVFFKFLTDFYQKVVIIFNLGFFVIAVYICIYYFHEFIYFINLDNISVFEYSSNDLGHCESSSKDMVSCDKSLNKQLDLFKDSKHNLGLLDFYNSKTKTDMLLGNMVYKNNSDNSDRLSIIKYLEIYRSIRVDFNKIENELINHNLDLTNKISKLEKGIDCSSNIINDIIDSYINDFSK